MNTAMPVLAHDSLAHAQTHRCALELLRNGKALLALGSGAGVIRDTFRFWGAS
ncbi:hypothetical protein [Comamonas antarctica]|uniref:hypothetical protein n=1 Tax=Comamonas antarctica TaxID=2743470 RepID=UPI0028F13E60|nr:hypothetical protein [Comamonas antarctica]